MISRWYVQEELAGSTRRYLHLLATSARKRYSSSKQWRDACRLWYTPHITRDELLQEFRSGKFFAFSGYLDTQKHVVVQFSMLPEHSAETVNDAFFQACQAHRDEIAMMVKLGRVEVCHLPCEHQASYITVQHPFTEENITVCQDCQALRVDALSNPPAEIHARITLAHGSAPKAPS